MLNQLIFVAVMMFGEYTPMINSLNYIEPTSVTITAYSNEEMGGDITATGKKTKVGYIAASRNLVKKWGYGSTIYIEDIGTFILEDTMNARYTNRLDVFKNSRKEAINFGIKRTCKAYKIGDEFKCILAPSNLE